MSEKTTGSLIFLFFHLWVRKWLKTYTSLCDVSFCFLFDLHKFIINTHTGFVLLDFRNYVVFLNNITINISKVFSCMLFSPLIQKKSYNCLFIIELPYILPTKLVNHMTDFNRLNCESNWTKTKLTY